MAPQSFAVFTQKNKPEGQVNFNHMNPQDRNLCNMQTTGKKEHKQ